MRFVCHASIFYCTLLYYLMLQPKYLHTTIKILSHLLKPRSVRLEFIFINTMGATTNIQVAVRVRPFLPAEAGSKSCIEVLPGDDQADLSIGGGVGGQSRLTQGKSVRIGFHRHQGHHPHDGHTQGGGHSEGHTFTFDKCFSGHATQVEIYQTLVVPLLTACLDGYNATTLAYGQTGAGEANYVDFNVAAFGFSGFWMHSCFCLFHFLFHGILFSCEGALTVFEACRISCDLSQPVDRNQQCN